MALTPQYFEATCVAFEKRFAEFFFILFNWKLKKPLKFDIIRKINDFQSKNVSIISELRARQSRTMKALAHHKILMNIYLSINSLNFLDNLPYDKRSWKIL